MVNPNTRSQLEEMFLRLSRTKREMWGTEEQIRKAQVAKGVKNLKRILLGFCGYEKVLKLEDLTDILLEKGAVHSREHGREIIGMLNGLSFEYHHILCLGFREANSSPTGEIAYSVYVTDNGAGITY